MPDRAKPTQVAKDLGIRPQIIYGLIKRGKIKTFDNPSGGPALVDVADTKIAVSRMGHRGPRKDKAHKGSKAPGGIKRGTILSRDRFPIKGAFAREGGGGRSVKVVTDPGRGENSLVWLSDGTVETFWGTESLAQRLQNKSTQIEQVPELLGMIMFQWREEGKEVLAESLKQWAVANEVGYIPINVGKIPHDDDEDSEDKKPERVEVEVELGPEGVDVEKVLGKVG